MNDHEQDQDQEPEEEEEEEILSLRDLPITLTADDRDLEDFPKLSDRRSSSESTAFFEFFSDSTSEMSHAEDIILAGKLRPLNQNPLYRNDTILQSFHRRRCESMSEPKTSTKALFMRSSRSLDHHKLLRRTSSSNSSVWDHRTSIPKPPGKTDVSVPKVSRPRWYVLIFGFVKFPPKMHLQDIRNRQVRRSPATLFPSGKGSAVNRSDRKSSWGLLRLLSCKSHASVAVTASFGCMTQI